MTAPYLYVNQNRHAPKRANGIRFWGYPRRQSRVRLIVIHTAENTPDYIGADGGAEAVARYQATGVTAANASSYHEIGDSDSHVVCLPSEAVAFGAKGANADGWHWSFATQARLWGSKPDWWKDAALDRAAIRCRLRADQFGIPIRRLTRTQIRAGAAGFAAHADTEAVYGQRGRRSDPGGGFPWDDFLDRIRRAGQPATPQEDIMASLADLEKVVAAAVTAEGATVREMISQVQARTNEAVRLSEAAATAEVARLRAELGLPPSPQSDAKQVEYLRHGRGGSKYTWADLVVRLRTAQDSSVPADEPGGAEDEDR